MTDVDKSEWKFTRLDIANGTTCGSHTILRLATLISSGWNLFVFLLVLLVLLFFSLLRTELVHGELYHAIKKKIVFRPKGWSSSPCWNSNWPGCVDEGLALAGKPRKERGQTVHSNRLQWGFKPLRLTHYLLVYFVSKPRQFIPIWTTCFFTKIVLRILYRHHERSQRVQNHQPVNFESHFPNPNNVQTPCILHQIAPNLFLFSYFAVMISFKHAP